MAKKLILGGNGLMGSAIMRHLLDDGEEVKVLIRSTSGKTNLDGYDVEVAYGDIRDGDSIRRALAGCDTVYFTAAHFSHYNPVPQLAYDVNVGGTRTALTAARDAGIEKVVYTSTNCTMGAHGPVPVTEDAQFNHWGTGDHYSNSKFEAETVALQFAAQGLPLVVVNPTYVIGVGDQRPTPSGQLLIDVVTGRVNITMDGYLNIIDVDDVARGQILAAQKGQIGARYLFGNANVTIFEFQSMIADIAGVPRPRWKAPFPLALGMAHVAEAWAKLTKTQPWETVAGLKIGHMGEHYDSSKAITELGLPQTPLEVTIRRALIWFEEHGYLNGRTIPRD